MNEIEKLYKSAGVEKFCNSDSEFCPVAFCSECIFSIYPPFTAEKQLELIKWLSDTDNYIKEICRMIDTKNYYIQTVYKYVSRAKTFEEALAGLINPLWQDLTDTEKEQVRSILEG